MARKPETPESHTRKPETRHKDAKPKSSKVKVRVQVPIGGTDVSYRPDTVYEMTADEAAKWCDGKRAREES